MNTGWIFSFILFQTYLQKAIIPFARCFACEEHPVAERSSHVFVMLIEFTNWPVGIGATEKGIRVPAGENHVSRLGNIITIHFSEHVHQFLLDFIIAHAFHTVAIVLCHSHHEDIVLATSREKAFCVHVLPHSVETTACWIAVQSKLCVIPELLREVQENL